MSSSLYYFDYFYCSCPTCCSVYSSSTDKQRKAAIPHIWEQIFDILPLKVNWCKWSGSFTTLVFNVQNLTFCIFSSMTHKGPFLQTFILSYHWVIWSIHPQWFNTSLFVFAAFPSCGWFSCTLRQNAFVEKQLLAAANTVDWFTEFYALVFAHTCVCKREFGALCIIMECHERMSLPLTDNGWLLRWTRTFYAHSERCASILYVADNTHTHSAGIVLYTYTHTHICWAAFLPRCCSTVWPTVNLLFVLELFPNPVKCLLQPVRFHQLISLLWPALLLSLTPL